MIVRDVGVLPLVPPMVQRLYRNPFLIVLVVAVLAIVVAVPRPALAEKVDARKHYDRATAAFGLGKYAEAATEYEAAFRLRPDPALLYNCAQSYRLAGNRPRAIELYRNYARLYGDAPNAEDARKHLANLEQEAAAERGVPARPVTAPPPIASTPAPATAPPPARAPAPIAAPVPAAAPTPAPAPQVATAPVAISPPAMATPPLDAPPPAAPAAEPLVGAPLGTPPAADDGGRSLLSRPWFWVAVGAVVVAGVVVAVVATSGDKDPSHSLGSVVAN